jgi:hypothetical protein
MALHRDIYWVGRQWAVTGYGLQLIDQRLKGVFDIEIARLWDQDVLDAMRAREWLKAEDFEKAIAAAHKRFPEPAPPCSDPPIEPVLSIETLVGPSQELAPAPATMPTAPSSAPELLLESESAKADAPSQPASPAEKLLSLNEPVASAPLTLPPLPPAVPQLPAESTGVKADPQNKPASPVDTLFRLSEPVPPASAKLPPSSLDFRAESERARADLESKMSALEGLLRSRGFVAAQPVIPPASILPVRAEGELAKFAPQWRVRN